MEDKELLQALCILNPDDVYDLKNNHAEEGYFCITPYKVLELKRQGISFPDEPHLQEGLVLTRKPDGLGYYFRTDETDCRVINERCLAIETILSYLGGKDFKYSEKSSFRYDKSVGVGLEAGGQKGGIEISNGTEINTNENGGNTDERSVGAKWSGNYTREGYNNAKKSAELNGLISDPAIAALLEQRDPSHPNPIKYQEYHVNVTSDLDKSLHVLEDIKANLKDKISGHLKVDVKTSRKVDHSSTVDFFVSFGPIPTEVSQKAIEDEKHVSPRGKRWLWPVVAIAAVVIIATVLIIVL